jgi:hypothetical protein
LPPALYLPRREHDEATLMLGDNSERHVTITFATTPGSATFVFAV